MPSGHLRPNGALAGRPPRRQSTQPEGRAARGRASWIPRAPATPGAAGGRKKGTKQAPVSSTNGRRGWWPTGLRGDEARERKGYSTRALEEAAYTGAGPQQASLTRRTANARLHTGRCPRVQWRPQRPGSPPGRRKRKRVWRVSGSTREQESEDPGACDRELQ